MTGKLRILGWVRGLQSHWRVMPVILLLQMLPPYTTNGYKLLEWGTVNAYILTHPIKTGLSSLYPWFQVIPLLMLALVFAAPHRSASVFSLYVALNYAIIAVIQNISTSGRYGFAVCTANVLTFLLLAGLWLWEFLAPQNQFQSRNLPLWKYWPILLAIIPFWYPVDPTTLLPDFNPARLLTSGAGLSFCMATPLYLGILCSQYPRVNKTVFLATALIGLSMSLGNFFLEFVLYPRLWWIGMLHFPLLTVSTYAVALVIGESVRDLKQFHKS